jgi:hypothetical protein
VYLSGKLRGGVDALQPLLPEELRKASQHVKVTSQNLDVTGSFRLLSDELTLEIFSELPMRDQLVCSTAVCRSWRQSFRNHPRLLTKLNFLKGGDYVRGTKYHNKCEQRVLGFYK